MDYRSDQEERLVSDSSSVGSGSEYDTATQLSSLQMVVRYNLNGEILGANELFTQVFGVSEGALRGKTHASTVSKKRAASKNYKNMWQAIKRGEHRNDECRRVVAGHEKIWLNSLYVPVISRDADQPSVVFEYSTNVTERKLEEKALRAQLEAIDLTQAVIEFEMDGTIRAVNDNFLRTMGYDVTERDEVIGKHHSIFVTNPNARS